MLRDGPGQTKAPEFQAGRQLLIIGGGYIGLEAAAVARQLGLEVTVLEMAERILQRAGRLFVTIVVFMAIVLVVLLLLSRWL